MKRDQSRSSIVNRLELLANEGNVEDLASELGIEERLVSTPPIDIQRIALSMSHPRVSSVKYVSLPVDGMLTPSSDGLTILINKHQRPERQRFTCAHEVVHALKNPTLEAHRQLPLLPYDSDERQCERLASMLLMPNPAFRYRANSLPPSINSIVKLARMFATSIQSTASRFVDVLTKPCLLIVSTFRYGRSGRTLRVKWPHQNTYNPDGRPKYFVPQNASVRLRTGLIAYRTEYVQSDTEDINLGNLQVRAQTQSRGFGLGENRYVLTLVFPDA